MKSYESNISQEKKYSIQIVRNDFVIEMELWRSSEKDLFGLLVILVMVIGTGTIIYILLWFKDEQDSSKSRNRMDKMERLINRWQIQTDERRRSECSQITN